MGYFFFIFLLIVSISFVYKAETRSQLDSPHKGPRFLSYSGSYYFIPTEKVNKQVLNKNTARAFGHKIVNFRLNNV